MDAPGRLGTLYMWLHHQTLKECRVIDDCCLSAPQASSVKRTLIFAYVELRDFLKKRKQNIKLIHFSLLVVSSAPCTIFANHRF